MQVFEGDQLILEHDTFLRCGPVRFPLPQKTQTKSLPSDVLYELNLVQRADALSLRPVQPVRPMRSQLAARELTLSEGFNLQVHLAQNGQSARVDFVRTYRTGGEDTPVRVAFCEVSHDCPHTLRLVADLFYMIAAVNRVEGSMRGTSSPPLRHEMVAFGENDPSAHTTWSWPFKRFGSMRVEKQEADLRVAQHSNRQSASSSGRPAKAKTSRQKTFSGKRPNNR